MLVNNTQARAVATVRRDDDMVEKDKCIAILEYELDKNKVAKNDAFLPYTPNRKNSLQTDLCRVTKIHAILRSFVETYKFEVISRVKYITISYGIVY